MSQENIYLYQEAIKCSIETLTKTIEEALRSLTSIDFCILRRVKNPETLRKKMCLKKADSVFKIEDVYGFRILTSTTDEVYVVSELITKLFDNYVDHDYIKTPKILPEQTHLESLRLLQIVAYKNEIPFEIQITTFEYHEINESLHERYHQKKYK